MDPRAVKKMILFHCATPTAAVLFYLYSLASDRLGTVLRGCLLHDWFHLYCPACGGTRAMKALLKGDLWASVRYNPLVTVLLGFGLYVYVKARLRLKRGEERLVVIPKPFWTCFFVFLIVFFILRNLLLIAFGIDPTGDLHWFWNQIG